MQFWGGKIMTFIPTQMGRALQCPTVIGRGAVGTEVPADYVLFFSFCYVPTLTCSVPDCALWDVPGLISFLSACDRPRLFLTCLLAWHLDAIFTCLFFSVLFWTTAPCLPVIDPACSRLLCCAQFLLNWPVSAPDNHCPVLLYSVKLIKRFLLGQIVLQVDLCHRTLTSSPLPISKKTFLTKNRKKKVTEQVGTGH